MSFSFLQRQTGFPCGRPVRHAGRGFGFGPRASRGQEFLVSEDPASSGLSFIMQEAGAAQVGRLAGAWQIVGP